MKPTLLDKAKSFRPVKKPKNEIQPGELELTLAYCRGEIKLHQFWHALGKRGSGNGPASHRIGVVIRQAIASGELQVKIKRS